MTKKKRRVTPIKHPGGLFQPPADTDCTLIIDNQMFCFRQTAKMRQAIADADWIVSLVPRLKQAGFTAQEFTRLAIIGHERAALVTQLEALMPAIAAGMGRGHGGQRSGKGDSNHIREAAKALGWKPGRKIRGLATKVLQRLGESTSQTNQKRVNRALAESDITHDVRK